MTDRYDSGWPAAGRRTRPAGRHVARRKRDLAASEPVDELVIDRQGRAAGGEAEDGVRAAGERGLHGVGHERADPGGATRRSRPPRHDLLAGRTSCPPTMVLDDLEVRGQEHRSASKPGATAPLRSRPRTPGRCRGHGARWLRRAAHPVKAIRLRTASVEARARCRPACRREADAVVPDDDLAAGRRRERAGRLAERGDGVGDEAERDRAERPPGRRHRRRVDVDAVGDERRR